MSRLRNSMYRYASVGPFIVAFVTQEFGITEVLMKGAGRWSMRGGRGYVGQFSRNSMGRDRHSNSRYPRPPSLEAGACSNKPQTPYPGSYLDLNPSIFPSLAPTVYPVRSPSRVPPRFSFPLSCYLSVSLPGTITPHSFDYSTTELPTPRAEVATTTQISFAP